MTVERSWQKREGLNAAWFNQAVEMGELVPDTRLQAIADAHEAVVLGRQTGDYQWEAVAIKQRDALLDALTEEVEDES